MLGEVWIIMEQLLDKIIEDNRYLTELGKLADYIPAL